MMGSRPPDHAEGCPGHYQKAEPHDYAALRCDVCNQGLVDDDRSAYSARWIKEGDRCRRVPEKRARVMRPTLEEQCPVYRQNMKEAGRGHLLP